MTRMANEYERADHDRDLRKHDTLPHRLDRPLSTAMDIALIVRGMSNVQVASDLIESYAQLVAADARLDEASRLGNRIIAHIEAPLVRKSEVA